jgi:flagellar protein FlbD
MVTLTRITGTQFALNPDLIERVDKTPDTVITLVDGTKYLVRESLDEVVAEILAYRAQVLASASAFERLGEAAVRRNRLTAVPTDADGDAHADPDEDAGGTGDDDTVVPVVPLTPRNA